MSLNVGCVWILVFSLTACTSVHKESVELRQPASEIADSRNSDTPSLSGPTTITSPSVETLRRLRSYLQKFEGTCLPEGAVGLAQRMEEAQSLAELCDQFFSKQCPTAVVQRMSGLIESYGKASETICSAAKYKANCRESAARIASHDQYRLKTAQLHKPRATFKDFEDTAYLWSKAGGPKQSAYLHYIDHVGAQITWTAFDSEVTPGAHGRDLEGMDVQVDQELRSCLKRADTVNQVLPDIEALENSLIDLEQRANLRSGDNG